MMNLRKKRLYKIVLGLTKKLCMIFDPLELHRTVQEVISLRRTVHVRQPDARKPLRPSPCDRPELRSCNHLIKACSDLSYNIEVTHPHHAIVDCVKIDDNTRRRAHVITSCMTISSASTALYETPKAQGTCKRMHGICGLAELGTTRLSLVPMLLRGRDILYSVQSRQDVVATD